MSEIVSLLADNVLLPLRCLRQITFASRSAAATTHTSIYICGCYIMRTVFQDLLSSPRAYFIASLCDQAGLLDFMYVLPVWKQTRTGNTQVRSF